MIKGRARVMEDRNLPLVVVLKQEKGIKENPGTAQNIRSLGSVPLRNALELRVGFLI